MGIGVESPTGLSWPSAPILAASAWGRLLCRPLPPLHRCHYLLRGNVLDVPAGDTRIGVAELSLNDIDRDALCGEFRGMGMPEAMRMAELLSITLLCESDTALSRIRVWVQKRYSFVPCLEVRHPRGPQVSIPPSAVQKQPSIDPPTVVKRGVNKAPARGATPGGTLRWFRMVCGGLLQHFAGLDCLKHGSKVVPFALGQLHVLGHGFAVQSLFAGDRLRMGRKRFGQAAPGLCRVDEVGKMIEPPERRYALAALTTMQPYHGGPRHG